MGPVKTFSGKHVGGFVGLEVLSKNFQSVSYCRLVGAEFRNSCIVLAHQPAKKPTKQQTTGTTKDRNDCVHI